MQNQAQAQAGGTTSAMAEGINEYQSLYNAGLLGDGYTGVQINADGTLSQALDANGNPIPIDDEVPGDDTPPTSGQAIAANPVTAAQSWANAVGTLTQPTLDMSGLTNAVPDIDITPPTEVSEVVVTASHRTPANEVAFWTNYYNSSASSSRSNSTSEAALPGALIRASMGSGSGTPANLRAVNFAISQVGDGPFSKYGLSGLNNEAGGFRGEYLGGWTDPKCNILVYDSYAAAGAAPMLANGGIPLASNWYNQSTTITASGGGYYEVVFSGNLSQINLNQLQPGDIVSNGEHVGIYAPIVYTSGESQVPGYSNLEVVNTTNSSIANGQEYILPQTISAATPNPNNLLSGTPT